MRGATYYEVMSKRYLQDFNPRAHEGRDTNIKEAFENILKISIHAPMRGAT